MVLTSECTDCFLTCASVSFSVVSGVEVIANVGSQRKTKHLLGFDLSGDILTGRIIAPMATLTNTNISANNMSYVLKPPVFLSLRPFMNITSM